ncbi:MAG: hypothetical protein H0W50_03770 [Parachlamydiaceae bacterium]|nr:hypothetical protein [Parachlamydiaceae bacterium]
MNLNSMPPKAPITFLQTEDPTKDPNFTIILPEGPCVRQRGSRQNTPENRHSDEIDKKITTIEKFSPLSKVGLFGIDHVLHVANLNNCTFDEPTHVQTTSSEIAEFARTSSLDIPKPPKTFNKLKLSVQSLEFLGIGEDSEISIGSTADASPDSEVSVTSESGYNTPQASPNYEKSELLLNEIQNSSNKLKLENFRKPKHRERIGVFIFEGT